MADYWDNAAFGTTSPAETAEKPMNIWDNLFGGAMNSLATLPKRAIDASAQDVQHLGEPDYQRQSIAPAVETALKMVGGASPFAQNQAVGVAGGRLGAIADKASARVDLNLSTRQIEKYDAKNKAYLDGTGPKLTPEERADWMNSFKRKQGAQQYLDSSQPME
jgi:hypothetical protein